MKQAAQVAAALVVLQLGVGAAMVMATLPPALRSAHEAVGIGVWLVIFLAAYLAKTADRRLR